MTLFDWLIIILLNGSVIAYGVYLGWGVKESSEWFLAGRSLPWWLVGVSMYATAIDSSDLVADSGGTYELGLSYFVTNWVGIVAGWAFVAFFVLPPIYRAGIFTNAQYLEARFGVTARVTCALIQVQYRALVLAIIAKTLFLTLAIVCGWGNDAWYAVIAIAILASLYTALGGLKSVAITDSLQFVIMTAAGLVIWVFVWNQVGGWDGTRDRLAESESGLEKRLLHVGGDHVTETDVTGISKEVIDRKLLVGGTYDEAAGVIRSRNPAWLMCVAFIIVGVGYSVVNHTQTMRMLAARSEWDLKMSVWVAGAAMLVMTFFNLTMGVMGRALYPDESVLPQGTKDAIYPFLVSQYSVVGLKGLVVAGVLAASFSTFDSIGSTLSALLTRDVYARLIVKDRNDEHYLRVVQWLTPFIIAGSFLYVPFMEGGMLLFYLDLTSAFVIPLLTLFIMGSLTRVNRKSGSLGLFIGAGYGALRLVAPWIAEAAGILVLPPIMINSMAAYLFSVAITALPMVIHSLIYGPEPEGELLHAEVDGWLKESQEALAPESEEARSGRGEVLPAVLAVVAVAAGMILSFVVFW